MATPSLSIEPAMPPPPGVQSNFTDPPTAGSSLYIFTTVGLVIAILFLVMRLYTKAYILKKFGAEDVTIVFAFIFTVATCALQLVARMYGTGRHMWDVPVTTLIPKWGEVLTASEEMYLLAIMSAKLAIILCYLRISPQKYFRISLYTTIAFVAGYHIAFMLALIFACHPIAKSWNFAILTGHCINRPSVYLINGVLNVVSDFVILILPLPMIRNIQMPLRQKFLVVGFFSVGSLACVISIVRLQSIIPILNATDQTWVHADGATWVAIELCVVITCGCLSVIRPFLRHFFPVLMGDTTRQTSHSRYSKGVADFFLYNKRRRNGQSESTSCVTQLGQPYIDSAWNNTEYTQDIRATRTADPAELGKARSPDEDVEMIAAGGKDTSPVHALSDDMSQEGIMIRKDVDVRRK